MKEAACTAGDLEPSLGRKAAGSPGLGPAPAGAPTLASAVVAASPCLTLCTRVLWSSSASTRSA